MSLKNSPNFLIFFVIVLICSITPATALQNETNLTGNVVDNWNDEWVKGVENALQMLSEQEYTELTPEQDSYLEEHQDQIQIKGEGVLYNLQYFLDYVDHELSKYNTTTNMQNKRTTNTDKFTDSIKEVTKFLKNKDIPVANETLTYGQLSNNTKYNNTYQNQTIVQIRTGTNDYPVYAELIDINNDNIIIKTSKKIETMKAITFINQYSLAGSLNVIIVPENSSTISNALCLIFGLQNKDLDNGITRCTTWTVYYLLF
jgi:hypothetical protein